MISTKGRYALRLLIDVAEHQEGGYIRLRDAAKRQGISEKYLEIIVRALVQEGYLTGVRGKGGGYRLSKAPEEYSVRRVLEAAEACGLSRATFCHAAASREQAESCAG